LSSCSVIRDDGIHGSERTGEESRMEEDSKKELRGKYSKFLAPAK
jgi:hypothetical protein